MIGLIYFFVIVLANSVGAISGMGGGVIIKPVLDFIGADSVSAISFYSTVAVFTMSVVSTAKQLKSGLRFQWRIILGISAGAIIGGIFGNLALEELLKIFGADQPVKMIQIIITLLTLAFAFFYTKYPVVRLKLLKDCYYLFCGLLLGFLASLLGIGGGPINVSLIMLMFSLPIKEATVYSIGTIFFSQLAKLTTIAISGNFFNYDLSRLYFVIPAAILGGWLGSKLSGMITAESITKVFQAVIVLVMVINVYNGLQIIF
ncbi:sulfite exporter TauE/SafE family protein [Enterococcus sp. LJL90]